MDELEGVVGSITYQNSGSNFIVFKLQCGQDKSSVTIVGKLPLPFIGEA